MSATPYPTRESDRTVSPEEAPLRAVYGLHDFITLRHLQNMAKVMLATA